MARLPVGWDDAEEDLARAVGRALSQQRRSLLEQIENGDVRIDESFWNDEIEKAVKILQSVFADIYVDGGKFAYFDLIGRTKASIFDDLLGLVNREAVDWALSYAYDLVKGITKTTRSIVEKAMVKYITTPGFTKQDFIDLTSKTFGAARAKTIATTETTRAYARAGDAIGNQMKSAGWDFDEIWNTRNDSLTCEICGPRNRKVKQPMWEIPAHPECRCWITRRLKGL